MIVVIIHILKPNNYSARVQNCLSWAVQETKQYQSNLTNNTGIGEIIFEEAELSDIYVNTDLLVSTTVKSRQPRFE